MVNSGLKSSEFFVALSYHIWYNIGERRYRVNKDQGVNRITFRKLFDSFDDDVKKYELERLQRVILGKPPITATDPNTGQTFQFNSVAKLIRWMKSQGVKNPSNSNIYKSLNNQRPSAYGYVIKYKDETG